MTTHAPEVEASGPEAAGPEAIGPQTIDTDTQSVALLDGPRCQHRYKNGKRCRLPASEPQFGLCPLHFRQRIAAGLPPTDDSSDLSTDLLRGIKFSSPPRPRGPLRPPACPTPPPAPPRLPPPMVTMAIPPVPVPPMLPLSPLRSGSNDPGQHNAPAVAPRIWPSGE